MNGFRQYSPGEYRPQFGGFSFFPPVVKNLLIANFAAFILQMIAEGGGFTIGGTPIYAWFAKTFYLWPISDADPRIAGNFQIWQVVTYMFLHGGFSHILFNMLALWMFGMEVENTWGSRNFLIFYFACGIAAALANLFIAPLFAPVGPTIGASGGVYGVLVAFAMLYPNRYVFISFLFPVKAKYLVTFYVMLEMYNGVMGSGEGVAHMAHLGGAVVGFVWVLMDKRGMIDRVIGTIQTRSAKRFIQYQQSKTPARDAQFYEMPRRDEPAKPDANADYQKTIDEILDKISRHGYSALTEDEKRMLLDASRRIQPGDES